jgi:hypothetical protein
MKAEELRLGNLVSNMNPRHNDSILTIESIGDNHEVNVFYRKYLLSELEPIPLTEEWLIKFGFSREAKIGGDGVEFRVYHFDILTFNTNHGWWYKCQPMNDTPLEYVHQLQNFYFALTGKELTLKS